MSLFVQNNIKEIEISILKQTQNLQEIEGYSEKNKIKQTISEQLNKIISLPFQSCSSDFYLFLLKNKRTFKVNALEPFLLVENYLRNGTYDSFKKLESYLMDVQKQDFDASGIEILRGELADGKLVRNVYRSQNRDLINLFSQYLPKPTIDLFRADGGPIPEDLIQDFENARVTIQKLSKDTKPGSLEEAAKIFQRRIRANIRRKQEIFRVMKVENCDEKKAKEIIREGNKPYMPKFKDQILAEKIFNTAFKVPDAPIIRHLTNAATFPQLFDGAIYGRQTLAKKYMAYRPASLFHSDQRNGDANVICFGPQNIDEKCMKIDTMEITLNMEKFKSLSEKRNPCIFFKQQDLGYFREQTRVVNFSNNESIQFNHTADLVNGRLNHTGFKFNPNSCSPSYAQVPFQSLISTNFSAITAIQTLNFFRYIDVLTDQNYAPDRVASEIFYQKIAKLDDDQLLDLLTRIHRASTDTAEFNFYGAYQVNPELVEDIIYYPNGNVLTNVTKINLPDLIDKMNKGDLLLFHETRKKMPVFFKSKRLVEFLRDKVTNPAAIEELKSIAL